MKPLLFFHHLWLWKDSDNLLGDVCVCVSVCVCWGGGVHIMYLCKIWGGGECVLQCFLKLLSNCRYLIFVVLKNKIQCTSPIVRPTLGKKLKPKLLIPSIALTKE